MIVVHHLENSQSIRVLWLLEELGMDYKVQYYKRDAETSLAPIEFKGLHIVGTAPCITDGELVLPETNAILDYIIDKSGGSQLRPKPGSEQRVRYLYWLHAAQGSFMPLLLDALIFKRMINKVPFFLKPIMKFVVGKVEVAYLKPRLKNMLTHIENELGKSTWFSGSEFTAADIVMGYCMDVAAVRVGMDDSYPNAQAFLKRMRERPAFKRAMKENGDFKPFSE
ncbi:glutathione S-transferase [Thalassomonas sp. RHCl1]|uniref:glutathione S-transferase family protein n=1 Tax=Thalassomonas sp. RHCl1 TaxID=2995320 RepID=UPI00248B4386|nr:glutathione S-transferase [Thalassomonas sp. RHCl1]